jgi:hypothetical protein
VLGEPAVMSGGRYDAAGQLSCMTRPNGCSIGYECYRAHRQRAVRGNKGDRIGYTRDNAGNETGQAVKDPKHRP